MSSMGGAGGEPGEPEEPEEPPTWGRLVSTSFRVRNVCLSEDTLSMGRSRKCDWKTPDLRVSAHHCRIERRKDGRGYVVQLVDLGSSNGTLLNNKRLVPNEPMMLRHNDVITMAFHGPHRRACISFTFQLMATVEERLNCVMQTPPLDEYEMGRELGKGAYGCVNLVIHRATGAPYALKVVDKKKMLHRHPHLQSNILREAEVLHSLKHPRITRMHYVVHTQSYIYLLMELVSGGELFDRIIARGRYPEEATRAVVGQVLDALVFMHDRNVVHRDIKPENILLVSADDDTTVKVTDFGLASFIGESGLKTYCGTPQYFAPEVLARRSEGASNYGAASDLWSVGVVTYVLLSGLQPFDETTREYAVRKGDYMPMNGPEWEGVSNLAKDFVAQLLRASPEERMTGRQALNHAWLEPWMREVGRAVVPPRSSRHRGGLQVQKRSLSGSNPEGSAKRKGSSTSVPATATNAATAADGSPPLGVATCAPVQCTSGVPPPGNGSGRQVQRRRSSRRLQSSPDGGSGGQWPRPNGDAAGCEAPDTEVAGTPPAAGSPGREAVSPVSTPPPQAPPHQGHGTATRGRTPVTARGGARSRVPPWGTHSAALQRAPSAVGSGADDGAPAAGANGVARISQHRAPSRGAEGQDLKEDAIEEVEDRGGRWRQLDIADWVSGARSGSGSGSGGSDRASPVPPAAAVAAAHGRAPKRARPLQTASARGTGRPAREAAPQAKRRAQPAPAKRAAPLDVKVVKEK